MTSRFRQLRLKEGISLLMVLITCPIIGGLIFYMHGLMSEVAQENASRFVQKTRQESIDNTTYLIEPVKDMVVTLSELGADSPAFLKSEIVNKYLYENLQKNGFIRELYVGYADGSFRQVVQLDSGTEFNGKRPPPDAKFATRLIDRSANRPASDRPVLDRFSFFAEWGRPLAELSLPATYDPRKRPYYTDTERQGGVQISDPYISASIKEPEITVSAPIKLNGQTVGVVGADITLASLSQYLKDYPASAHGITLIADRRGSIIASSGTDQAWTESAGALQLHTLAELENGAVTTALLERSRHRGDSFKFVEPDSRREYLALFSPFPASFGKPWEVMIVVPSDDFVGDINRIAQLITIIGGLAVAGAIILIYSAAILITRPLERLTGEIDAISALKVDSPVAVRSSFLEIRKLIDATKLLRSSIKAFAAFVPRGLVQELLKSDTALEIGGQSRYLTVLFSDIKDFSALAEAQPARDLFIQMSTYFQIVTTAINEEQGTVDKFIGDAVMAFWGAPALREDHAYRACVAAVKSRRRMEARNREWAAAGKPGFHMRIGIHSDAVLVGNVGSAERLSYTVFGDGVNIASRLEGTNKEFGTKTCVSHAVFRETGERLWLRPIDQVTVKGRRGDLTIYELVAIRDGDAETAASPEEQELCRLTADAFTAYSAHEWSAAASRYAAIAETFPADALARVMLQRCRERSDEKPALRQVPT